MNLKSVFCVFLVMFLLVSSSSVLGKESNEKNLNLFTKGIKEQVTLSGTIDPKQDKVELVEVHGKSVKGKFDVTSKNFNAVIKEEDSSKSYYLEGRMVLNNDSSLLYEGTVNSNKLFTFQAILSKAEENEDKYKASITLQKFKDEQKKEVTFGQTYSFNGKKASVKKFNQIRSKGFNSESTMFYISSNGDYYEFLGSVHGTYMNTAVWGPSEIGKGEADNHQLRSTTESSEVNE